MLQRPFDLESVGVRVTATDTSVLYCCCRRDLLRSNGGDAGKPAANKQ